MDLKTVKSFALNSIFNLPPSTVRLISLLLVFSVLSSGVKTDKVTSASSGVSYKNSNSQHIG